MMGHFLGQFGLSLTVAPIMRIDKFPVNFYPRLNRERPKAQTSPMLKMLKAIFPNSDIFPQEKFK